MSITTYDLGFSVASRTIFSRRLSVIHWDGFELATSDDFPDQLPPPPDEQSIDGYVVHSVAVTGNPEAIRNRGNHLLYMMQTYPRYVTRFEGSFEDFLQGMSSKSRSTLRRKVRKFASDSPGGRIDWREYANTDEITEFLRLATPLAARTYQARLFDGALPDTTEFRDSSLQAARNGELRAWLLFLDGNPVAYLYTPLVRGSYVYAFLGYDESEAHRSPGTVLQYLVHEKLFSEKTVRAFDFTEGDGPHKALFANESTPCATILYLPDTASNRILVHFHRFWTKGVESCKSAAARFKLQTRLKRIFR